MESLLDVLGSVKSSLASHGFVFVPRLLPHLGAESVASAFGPILNHGKMGEVQRLAPRAEAPPNTYGGMFGLGSFPFHTDLAHWRAPPRFILLRCITGSALVPTMVIDSGALVPKIGSDLLQRALFKPRRPDGGQTRLIRLLEYSGCTVRFRWDSEFLKPASPIGERAKTAILEELPKQHVSIFHLVEPGDSLFIDNWRVVHSRGDVPHTVKNRLIHRVYMESAA